MLNRPALLLLATLLMLPLGSPLSADEAESPKTPKALQTADYGKWERLGMWGLSQNGEWIAWQVRRADGETALHLSDVKGERTATIEYGSGQAFSKDGRFMAFRIGVSEKEREKLAKMKKPAPDKIGLRDLTKGETEEIEGIASFAFSDDGAFLLLRRSKPKGQKHAGTTVLVRDLAKGTDTSFGNVATASWMDERSLLALAIDAEDKLGNGVQLFDAATGRLRTLDSSKHTYSRLAWRKDAGDLAVLQRHEHEKEEDPCFVVMTWRGVDTDSPKAAAYDHRTDDGFSKEMRVVDLGGLRWAKDGGAVFFGIKAWENKPKPKKEKKGKQGRQDEKVENAEKDKQKKPARKSDGEQDKPDDGADEEQEDAPEAEPEGGDAKPSGDAKPDADAKPDPEGTKAPGAAKKEKPKTMRETLKDPSGVEIWHAKDLEVQPRQKKVYSQKKNENHLCAWWLDTGKLVQLGDDVIEEVRLEKPHTRALGLDNTPWELEKRFGPTLSDLYLIDTREGAKQKVLERNKYRYGTSPDGRYLLYQKDGHLWTYDAEAKRHVNLTKDVKTSFIDEEISALTDEKPSFGIAGWTEDGTYVFPYDKYDIWMMRSDGSSVQRLTQGAEKKVRYRWEVLDREEDEYIRADRPMLLRMSGELTKKSGYARMQVLGEGNATPQTLIWKDASIGRVVKAKDADVYAFVEETFSDAPDIFLADPSLKPLRQVSTLNAFQTDYAWSPRSVLVNYKSASGEPLQGALHYPAGYIDGKTYPMIVDIYEKRSSGLHRYSALSERHPYNAGVWTTQGYFVLQPDIVYRPQNPGLSAVECVVPAVKAAIAQAGIDPKRVGLVGHSWGAYQTAFIVTQTDVFAAGVAGAPLTNMISMSMGNYWNSGRTNAWIFHESQGRMDKPFWQDVETYIKNSPIFHVEKLETPLLIAFGDKDGAVDWHQGVEMYNAARLAQRPLVMLVYPGENHGLRQKPNQVDYHHRVREWFDHHLKGDQPKDWITKGKSHMERQKELEALKKKKKGPPGPKK